MNLITHRITLDVLKSGVQKILHGFYAGDVLSRRITVTLTAGSTSVELAQDATAVMYITKANGVENINACTVEGNTVFYDLLQTDTDAVGIANMQVKVISNGKVVYAPVFAIEIQSAIGDDVEATTSPVYTALEAALIKAETVYNARLLSVDIEEDLTFVATYADGTTHTSDAIKNAFAEQNDVITAAITEQNTAIDNALKEQSEAVNSAIDKLETLEEEVSTAEQERVAAETQRTAEHEAVMQAEAERVIAEQQRETRFSQLESDVQDALDETTVLQDKVNALVAGGGKVDEETFQSIIDAASAESNEYTDTKISELLGGAPEALDTLKEVADAMAENDTVVEALNSAIGSKADQIAFDEHINNGDIHITSDQAAAWDAKVSTEELQNAISTITSGETPLGNAAELEGYKAEEFLLKTETAADSNKLGGQESSYYASAESVGNIVNGATTVAKATNADSATKATTADSATKATTADSAAKATADSNGNNIAETYLLKSAVVITATDPGEGASTTYPDNTLIFVKKTS
ncbi:MAG: hypothetical protein J6K15_06340 [Lachnospiraceae bacterium]|nr:hypothetical protein [Lachnospiraceae bacterium]